MPLSSAAKTAGWSASKRRSTLWFCSSPRPKKFWTLIWLWTPFCHDEVARHLNWAASGAPISTSRASSNAWTFTPLSATGFSVVVISGTSLGSRLVERDCGQ